MLKFKREVYTPGGLFTEKEIDDYNYIMHVEETREACKEIARRTVIQGLFDYLPYKEQLKRMIMQIDPAKLHAAFNCDPKTGVTYGTRTGRIYSDKPNFTNVPKSK